MNDQNIHATHHKTGTYSMKCNIQMNNYIYINEYDCTSLLSEYLLNPGQTCFVRRRRWQNSYRSSPCPSSDLRVLAGLLLWLANGKYWLQYCSTACGTGRSHVKPNNFNFRMMQVPSHGTTSRRMQSLTRCSRCTCWKANHLKHFACSFDLYWHAETNRSSAWTWVLDSLDWY